MHCLPAPWRSALQYFVVSAVPTMPTRVRIRRRASKLRHRLGRAIEISARVRSLQLLKLDIGREDVQSPRDLLSQERLRKGAGRIPAAAARGTNFVMGFRIRWDCVCSGPRCAVVQRHGAGTRSNSHRAKVAALPHLQHAGHGYNRPPSCSHGRGIRPGKLRLRPFAEKLITLARRGDLHARRLVERRIKDRETLGLLFREIGPRFAARPGGYTRILKLGHRVGDGADVARIELLAE